jgi:proline iminopeptidase
MMGVGPDNDQGLAVQRTGGLYPPIDSYDRGHLNVGDGHCLYWETCGNPKGFPALFLHGGPGGGCNADHRRLFDPQRYRIVLFDQRGCGRSLPVASLQANTTQHLVNDIELLRRHLGIERWLILGGSWGATLALLYAQSHRERVEALVLRGVFSGRKKEIDWLYQFGASELFPEAWLRFIGPIPEDERGDLLHAYHRRLTSSDMQVRISAARSWCAWEASVMTLLPRASAYSSSDDNVLALARIETHFFVNDTFIAEGQVLRDAHKLAGLPGIIVQGRYDVVTPPVTAYDLHLAWLGSRLDIVPDAGHATSEPGIMRRMVQATDEFAR